MATTTATPPSQEASPPSPAMTKPIHSLVLDTGPLIKNDPSVSDLIAKAEKLYTIPSVIPEIRDPATRSRVETQLLPFVEIRAPKPASIRFIQGFARRTGDLAVLSRPDLEVLALAYELECERNGGDWRLRNLPSQKRLNGRPPNAAPAEESKDAVTEGEAVEPDVVKDDAPAVEADVAPSAEGEQTQQLEADLQNLKVEDASAEASKAEEAGPVSSQVAEPVNESTPDATASAESATTPVESAETTANTTQPDQGVVVDETTAEAADSDDEDGWITPSNLSKHQAADASPLTAPSSALPPKTLQAALLTSDYAMQNVALRINLNLLSPTLSRITHLKTWVLRCHGCFTVTKDTSRQFCPSCGQPTLIRTSCSTDDHGNFTVHLKRNFQWNKRGNVYSVPKPTHGTANGRGGDGGGKNGWGKDLIFAEDQKEYTKRSDEARRQRKKDIMDQDYLPGIMGGDRKGADGRIRVGAGRSVNSKKKR